MLGALVAVGCKDATSADRRSASARVTVTVSGNGADPDGFFVTVGGSHVAVRPPLDAEVAGLDPGEYTASIDGLADNCAADTSAQRVDAASRVEVAVHFAVECFGGFSYSRASSAGGGDIFYLDERGQTTQLTSNPGQHYSVDWSPDGASLLVQQLDLSAPGAPGSLWLVPVNASGARPIVTVPPNASDSFGSFSPNGARIVFCRTTSGGNPIHAVHIVSIGGGPDQTLIPAPIGDDCYPVWSPDGTQIAFLTGRFDTTRLLGQLAIAQADGTGLRLVSSGFSLTESIEWPNGDQFITVDGFVAAPFRQSVYRVPVGGGSPSSMWTPTSIAYAARWSPDGSRVLLSVSDGSTFKSFVANADGSSALD